jgi:hypothetical protein
MENPVVFAVRADRQLTPDLHSGYHLPAWKDIKRKCISVIRDGLGIGKKSVTGSMDIRTDFNRYTAYFTLK